MYIIFDTSLNIIVATCDSLDDAKASKAYFEKHKKMSNLSIARIVNDGLIMTDIIIYLKALQKVHCELTELVISKINSERISIDFR